jgi:peptide/nickel transport system ATP-binding protein/oligopeptide transport system ATP-binding protein
LPRPAGRLTAGTITLDGARISGLAEPAMERVRGRALAMVFQEPMTALNPVFTVGEQIAETVRLRDGVSAPQARERGAGLLSRVGIPDPGRRLAQYPHELSGGMRQRVVIAIALACRPKLLIADEPTTALDATVQAQVLRLLADLQAETGMAIMLITHDLGVIAQTARRAYVMYAGRVVEHATVVDLFDAPAHPYTRALLRSIPALNPGLARLPTIGGTVPAPGAWPPGCRFAPRCALADAACAAPPPVAAIRSGRQVACVRPLTS